MTADRASPCDHLHILATLLATVLLLAAALMAVGARAEEPIRIGGTGIGLALSKDLGAALRAADPAFAAEVLPSLGTPGGLKALNAGAVDVAIAARPLKPEETAGGAREAACLTTALTLATSRPAAPGIDLSDLPKIYANPDPRWPDGQPLKIILRSPAGSENPYLVRLIPGMAAALASAFERPGIPVGATDQENATTATRTEGSLAIITLLQIMSEKLALTPLAINGVKPTPASLADRSYPMPMRVCFVVPAKAKAGTDKFIAFVRSQAGQEIIRHYGSEPDR